MINDSQHDIVQSNEIIELLENTEAQEFLHKHFNERPENLTLRYSGKVNFNLTKLTQILHLYHKAQNKLPQWVSNRCALHPKSYAQSSHWEIAAFKSSIFKGKSILDLTAGLGVDITYMAQSFEHATALERDFTTFQFATYNQKKLGPNNIDFIHGDLQSFTFNSPYDVIYLDPDRRPDNERKLGDIENYSPNIIDGHKTWLKYTNCLLIKLSPMVDLTLLERSFKNLKSIYVIGYRNEVKEVLIELTQIQHQQPERISINITQNHTYQFSGHSGNKQTDTNDVGNYLLEPSKPLIKSGLAQQYCADFSLIPIKQNGLYYMCDRAIQHFDGRQYKIVEHIDPSLKSVKKYLKNQGIKSLEISQRHFFEDVRAIRQKLKIKEGGAACLHFTTDNAGKPLCFRTERVTF